MASFQNFQVTLVQSSLGPWLCAAGYSCTAESLSIAANPCAAGRYAEVGNSTCASCWTVAGNYCPRASATLAGVPCPVGQFSLGGVAIDTCSPCPAGKWTRSIHISNASCVDCATTPGSPCPADSADSDTESPSRFDGPACPAGQFKDGGTVLVECSACFGGYSCPAGSMNGMVALCPAGQYSLPGWPSCANCTAGYVCPSAGSVNGTVIKCPAGQYSLSGWSNCGTCTVLAGSYCPAGSSIASGVACPPGRFSFGGIAVGSCAVESDSPGLNVTNVVSSCPAGQYALAAGGLAGGLGPSYRCDDCASSCQSCIGPLEDQCVSCDSGAFGFIWPLGASLGRCVGKLEQACLRCLSTRFVLFLNSWLLCQLPVSTRHGPKSV